MEEKSSESKKGDQEPRIVVALNFGATHTSVAYLLDRDEHDTDIQDQIKDIHIIENWPAHQSPVVPNQISYSPTAKGFRQWGYDIDSDSHVHDSLRSHLEDGSRHEELVSLRNLVQGATVNSELGESVLPLLHKSPETIASDYLQKVAEHFQSEFGYRYNHRVLGFLPLDLVVGYPSLWPDAAKRRYFQVIESAFTRSLLPTLRHVYFVAEAEAVSQFCILSEYDILKANSRIRRDTSSIVCDTESSNVEAVATSYAFDRADVAGFKLRKIGFLARADAGWALVEKELQTLLRFKYDLSPISISVHEDPTGRQWNMLLNRFEPVIRQFEGSNPDPVRVVLPRGLPDQGIGITDGILTLSNDDLKDIFEPSIKSLTQMLSHQLELADISKTPAKAIIFNGEFTNNKYVLKRLKDFAWARRIEALCAQHSGNTARGLIVHALGMSTTPITPVMKLQHHYGVACNSPSQPSHSAKDQPKMMIEWALRKGDAIFPDDEKPRQKSLRSKRQYRVETVSPQRMSKVIIAISSQDAPPNYLQEDQDLKTASTRTLDLEFDMTLIPQSEQQLVSEKSRFFGKTKNSFFIVKLSIDFQVEESIVTVRVSCGEKLLVESHIPDESDV